MNLSRLLIIPALWLVTGYTPPALAETYTLPTWEVLPTCWYYGDSVNDIYHYSGVQGLDWGRFNGVRWYQPAVGAPLTVTDDTGSPIPYTVAVALAADHRHLLVTIEPDGRAQLPGDWNGDGRKTIEDVFGFVGEWFATAGTVGELFTFLEAWTA